MNNQEHNQHAVVGQKYAYATISLIMGIACFVNFLGMEKAILAIIFGWLALRSAPPPALSERRSWAKAGLVLGSILLVVVPTMLIIFFDRIRELIDLIEKFSSGR